MNNRQVRMYSASGRYFLDLFDRKARQMPAPEGDLAQLKAWQAAARAKLRELLGLDIMEKCPPNPEVVGRVPGKYYDIERVNIQSAPGLVIPLTVLAPKGLKPGEARPALLHAFGHGGAQKMADNFLPGPNEPDPDAFARGRFGVDARGLKKLACEGYVVIAADTRGSGERRDFAYAAGEVLHTGADNPMNCVASALGASLLGYQVWDMMRMADYALSRPEVDGRLGVCGNSGGGHLSLFFGALDPRVSLVGTSTWFYGFREALVSLPHNCGCNFVPGLFRYFDICDIASMICPRALMIESGLRDQITGPQTGLGNVLTQYALAENSYRLYGAPSQLDAWFFDGGHGNNPWDGDVQDARLNGQGFFRFARAKLPLETEARA